MTLVLCKIVWNVASWNRIKRKNKWYTFVVEMIVVESRGQKMTWILYLVHFQVWHCSNNFTTLHISSPDIMAMVSDWIHKRRWNKIMDKNSLEIWRFFSVCVVTEEKKNRVMSFHKGPWDPGGPFIFASSKTWNLVRQKMLWSWICG